MIVPRRTGKGGLLVVICTAVDRGRPKDTLKPSSVGGLGIEGEARCGPAKRFRRIPNAVAAGGLCATTSHGRYFLRLNS